MHAQGNIDRNIIMRPVKLNQVKDYRMGKEFNTRHKRHLRISEEEDFDIRLCQANQNGTICPQGANQGFVELFNKTTMQWVPMCDPRFSERNAEVVCRQLGFSNLNVHLDFDQRIEYRADSLSRIIYWPEPYQCTGNFYLRI